MPGLPGSDGCPQAAKNVLAGFGADLPQHVIVAWTGVVQELRMRIDRPRNTYSALVQVAITNYQRIGLSQSLRKSQQFRNQFRTNAGGITKQ